MKIFPSTFQGGKSLFFWTPECSETSWIGGCLILDYHLSLFRSLGQLCRYKLSSGRLFLRWCHPSLMIHGNQQSPHSYLCLLSLSLSLTVCVMFAQFTTQQVFPLPAGSSELIKKKSVCLHASPLGVPIRSKSESIFCCQAIGDGV